MIIPLRQYPAIVDQSSFFAGCSCGKPHPSSGVTLFVRDDACRVLAEDCRAIYCDRPVLLVSDPDTDAVAGKTLRNELQRAGVSLEHLLLKAHPVATADLAEQVAAVAQGKALIIGVGAGTVNDLGKFAAGRSLCDYWSLPTAPSMNGYTSGIVALKVKGVKRTLPAAPPQRIYAVPRIIQQAPLKMRQAGFCDVLAKVVSDIDWQCESLLQSRSYCELPSALMHTAEQGYAHNPEGVAQGEPDVVGGLFEGLLISGVAMSLAGSSAPASGGEHLISHFWDMREAVTGRKPELHGLQVGLGIILATACYARLAECRSEDCQADAATVYARTEAAIPEIWGPLAEEVTLQLAGKREILQEFDHVLPQYWGRLHPLFQKVQSPRYFVDLFTRTGAPFTLKAFGLSAAEFRLAALNARAIRSRLTVLDLAAHLGVLEAATEDALRLLV
ncbi:iron-containing alcohol dehydrogenase [Geopsychrobacter electrodiphilus]|uniref:iron-containing alcohol dehydrogenase n=1 Tax=Geopsychrobacter electrodiphilus TaxID=225196 RepID=UPI000377CEF5|nr:iron-containing alcohol dehydrogenase [Geopsychrobacter electrodiphilus]